MPSDRKIQDSIKLFWNVQFIYELELAKKELEAFNVEYILENNLREIKINSIPDKTAFLNRTADFEDLKGEPSTYAIITKANVTRSLNQYLTHWFYPYKGKYHPQMIRALLNIMKVQSGETILDPFIGSGTTALEAQLLGINCIGVDISEVCVRVAKSKTLAQRDLGEIISKYHSIFSEFRDEKTSINNTEEVIKEIEHRIDSIRDVNVHNFFKVASLIAYSDKARRKKKDFASSFLKNVDKMITSLEKFQEVISQNNLNLGIVQFDQADAKHLDLDDNSIDGIICSPPYSIALDYVENDKHALEALGYNTKEIKEEFIGVRGSGNTKVDLYNQDLLQTYKEMDRVLKPGKYCSIVIGNATVNKQEVRTVEYTIDIFKAMGYSLEMNVDKIIFGLYNVMQKENVLIFKKSS